MNLPNSRLATRFASAAFFALIAAIGFVNLAHADTPPNRVAAAPSPTPSPTPLVKPCPDCPPIVIGHPKGGENPYGIIVGPDELKIFPSPRPINGHVYSISKSGNVTTVFEDGVAKMTITFRGNQAYIGLPGSKPLVVINVAP